MLFLASPTSTPLKFRDHKYQPEMVWNQWKLWTHETYAEQPMLAVIAEFKLLMCDTLPLSLMWWHDEPGTSAYVEYELKGIRISSRNKVKITSRIIKSKTVK